VLRGSVEPPLCQNGVRWAPSRMGDQAGPFRLARVEVELDAVRRQPSAHWVRRSFSRSIPSGKRRLPRPEKPSGKTMSRSWFIELIGHGRRSSNHFRYSSSRHGTRKLSHERSRPKWTVHRLAAVLPGPRARGLVVRSGPNKVLPREQTGVRRWKLGKQHRRRVWMASLWQRALDRGSWCG